MKARFYLLTLMVAALSSMSLCAQNHYEGHWPEGEGILYSQEDGLIFGTFVNGKPDGKCVCYLPNGEVYWGDYRKGKATGNGRIYRDNGIVVSGGYKKGRYHGLDTLYRSDGTVFVGKYRGGKLKGRVYDSKADGRNHDFVKPSYPRIDLRFKQENFLRDQEIRWEERNLAIRERAGMVHPRFQGGGVDDFAYWINSRVEYPASLSPNSENRTVIVEFTVRKDGSLSDIHAVFGSNSALNEAAVKAVSKSPKWQPAEQNGEKKSVRLTVPVIFNME